MATGKTTPLTIADKAKIGDQYRGGQSVNSMVLEWGISPTRLKRIVAEQGIPARPKEISKKLWKDAQAKRKTAGSLANSGSEAQLNGGYQFSTPETVKPPKKRRAATTPRSRWVEVADFCDRCAGLFSIHAPQHVASRAHVLWVQKHKCERATG